MSQSGLFPHCSKPQIHFCIYTQEFLMVSISGMLHKGKKEACDYDKWCRHTILHATMLQSE